MSSLVIINFNLIQRFLYSSALYLGQPGKDFTYCEHSSLQHVRKLIARQTYGGLQWPWKKLKVGNLRADLKLSSA